MGARGAFVVMLRGMARDARGDADAACAGEVPAAALSGACWTKSPSVTLSCSQGFGLSSSNDRELPVSKINH